MKILLSFIYTKPSMLFANKPPTNYLFVFSHYKNDVKFNNKSNFRAKI